jgi:AraC family transcriptional regulator
MELEKIQHVVRYIEENYHRIIPVEELEDVGCYSYRNLQRVFQNIFKESLGAFQKRLKLENGYKKLIYTHDSITDVAYVVGFESLQAFTKSFKKQFQLSPTEARLNKHNVFERYINQCANDLKIMAEIVYLKPLKVFYQSIKTTHYNNQEIDSQWNKIDAVYGQNSSVKYFGIIVDQPLITTGKHCRYEAAISQPPNSKAFMVKEIFGGKYLKYIHQGSYETIENTYRMIYKGWLVDLQIEFDNSPVIEHYAIHHFNTEIEEDFITEIFFPIRKN